MTTVKATFLRNNRPEVIFYLLCWVFVLLVPIFLEAYDSAIDSEMSFRWRDIGFAYLSYIPFFIAFLLSKLVFEPRYYFAGHYRRFFIYSVLAAIILTLLFSYVAPVHRQRRQARYRIEQQEIERAEAVRDSILRANMPLPPAAPPGGDEYFSPERRPIGPDGEPMFPHRGPHKHSMMRGPIMPMFFMTLLMMGASLGIAIAFRYRRDQLELKEKQAARLQSELDYLKYQINPHFFMNTLNNIHALVDIDSELAKDAIIELSRMMRYLLYESNQPTVSFLKELNFVQHYLELMRLRCDESVQLTYQPPTDQSACQQSQVPPMMLISFIENAFKHGISHQEPSFIRITIEREGERYHFHCCNSNFSSESNAQQQGGVGLDNVRKRLELIYPDQYTLQIVPTDTDFTVDLWWPV